MKTIAKTKNKNSLFWIGGDFNLPDINWETESCKIDSKINLEFLDTIRELGLNQIIDFKTNDKNILDLFLTNNPNLITRKELIPGLGDHNAIIVNNKVTVLKKTDKTRRIFLWKKAT